MNTTAPNETEVLLRLLQWARNTTPAVVTIITSIIIQSNPEMGF